MYATTSLRDACRKFRAKAPGFLYAFGQQEFFVFVMGDAHKVNEVLPDKAKWREAKRNVGGAHFVGHRSCRTREGMKNG